MRGSFRAILVVLWGGMLIVTGLLTGNPEPIAKLGADGTTALVSGLGFGAALVIVGGWWLLTYRRRRV